MCVSSVTKETAVGWVLLEIQQWAGSDEAKQTGLPFCKDAASLPRLWLCATVTVINKLCQSVSLNQDINQTKPNAPSGFYYQMFYWKKKKIKSHRNPQQTNQVWWESRGKEDIKFVSTQRLSVITPQRSTRKYKKITGARSTSRVLCLFALETYLLSLRTVNTFTRTVNSWCLSVL